MLVMTSSGKSVGPKRVGPTKPVVVVLNPSIDFARKETSSTYTPGARYSGIRFSSHLQRRSRRRNQQDRQLAPAGGIQRAQHQVFSVLNCETSGRSGMIGVSPRTRGRLAQKNCQVRKSFGVQPRRIEDRNRDRPVLIRQFAPARSQRRGDRRRQRRVQRLRVGSDQRDDSAAIGNSRGYR